MIAVAPGASTENVLPISAPVARTWVDLSSGSPSQLVRSVGTSARRASRGSWESQHDRLSHLRKGDESTVNTLQPLVIKGAMPLPKNNKGLLWCLTRLADWLPRNCRGLAVYNEIYMCFCSLMSSIISVSATLSICSISSECPGSH